MLLGSIWRGLWDRIGDHLTTSSFAPPMSGHKIGVQELFKVLQKNGFIYKNTYTGQYCVSDEMFVDSAGPGAPCPECGRPTETISGRELLL